MGGMNRRLFLQRAGGAALMLPLLQYPGSARAQGGAFPRRLVVFYSPNGTKKERWSPGQQGAGGTERDFQLGPLLAPLVPFKDRLLIFDGIDNKAALEGPGGPHQRGMASLLTGRIIGEGDFVGGDGRRAGWADGISIDQFVASKIGIRTAKKSIELGARVLENVPRGRMIYAGAQQPIPPENDPISVHTRLFGRQDMDPAQMRRLISRRRSVLDSVKGDFARLRARVSGADREKLELHATSVRELEMRLNAVANPPPSCRPLVPGPSDNVMNEGEFSDIMRAQIELMVMALACDVTRVASLQCSTAVNALRFTFMGNQTQGHALSHKGNSNVPGQTEWERMLIWYADQYAYLLNRLDAVPEGDGTMLDNTLVLWVNELSRGNSHDLTDLPFVLAGGSNFTDSGRYLAYDGVPHNRLLLSVLHLLGLPETCFGDRKFCTGGPLVGLS